MLGFLILIIIMLIFWGNIFGHDQKNESYRILSRLGIHPGKVWWSRMLPAAILYVPVLPCFLFYLFATLNWEGFILGAQVFFTAWLSLMAIGAFASISSGIQKNGVSGTIVLCYVLAFWVIGFMVMFGSSPLWTTVPIALTLLLASRLRAGYWLREITTWRSRLIPVAPVLATILAILVALPFVRVYSVPYVSWSQIEVYFEQADLAGTPAAYREYLLQSYTEHRDYARHVFSGQFMNAMDSRDQRFFGYYCISLMPWEESRRERILRLHVISALVESNILLDERAIIFRNYLSQMERMDIFHSDGFDGVWSSTKFDSLYDWDAN
jgi:hypothetical protein